MLFKRTVLALCVPAVLAAGMLSVAPHQDQPKRVSTANIADVQGGAMSCKWAFALTVSGLLFAETGVGAAAFGVGLSGMLDNC